MVSDSSAVVTIGGCFAGKGMVLSESSGWKPMSELRVGDRVMSMNEAGQLEYSQVLSFMDKDSSAQVLFYTLHLQDNKSVTLTGKHLIFASSQNITSHSDSASFRATFAENVQEGQYVYVVGNEVNPNQPRPSRVVKVSVETHRGVYAPLTATGTIVVDAVVASCYAYTENVALAHFGFAPMRLYHTIESYVPFSLWTSEGDTEGFHWYARMLYGLGSLLLSDDVLFSPFSQ